MKIGEQLRIEGQFGYVVGVFLTNTQTDTETDTKTIFNIYNLSQINLSYTFLVYQSNQEI